MHESRGIPTAILAIVDPYALIFFLGSDPVHGADGSSYTCKVDKGTVLFLETIHQFNIAILGKVLFQLLFGHVWMDVAQVDVS